MIGLRYQSIKSSMKHSQGSNPKPILPVPQTSKARTHARTLHRRQKPRRPRRDIHHVNKISNRTQSRWPLWILPQKKKQNKKVRAFLRTLRCVRVCKKVQCDCTTREENHLHANLTTRTTTTNQPITPVGNSAVKLDLRHLTGGGRWKGDSLAATAAARGCVRARSQDAVDVMLQDRVITYTANDERVAVMR